MGNIGNIRVSGEVTEWTPGSRAAIVWNVVGLGLAALGIAVFSLAYAVTHGGEVSVTIGIADLSVPLLVIATLLPLHELIHGLAMRAFGARPSYGAGVLGKMVPYLYCTAPGYLFTKAQFIAVALAPFVAISLIGMMWVMYGPWGGWLIVPLGFHLGGCIGDFTATALVLTKSCGTLVEDLRTGMRFHSTNRNERYSENPHD